ncbi:DUF4339 domain-containing protein [Candidatus Sumerlaeota bacterium]|nr:DUF4339 domain-containing protein [Candidatus Sumerlaeota bacterium]
MALKSADSEIEQSQWHVTARDGKLGPLTLSQVAELATAGKISPRSLAWKVGMPTWRACGTIPELAPLFVSAPAQEPVWLARLKSLLGHARRIEFEKFWRKGLGQLKQIRLSRRQIAALIFLLAALGSNWVYRKFLYTPPHDDLVALFASQEAGATGIWNETAKIEKKDHEYRLSEKKYGRWIAPEPLKPMAKEALVELFGKNWKEAKPVGLVSGSGEIAVIHVRAGWESQGFTCTTGYFLMKPTGPVEIKKTEPRTLALPSLAPKIVLTPTPAEEKPIAEAGDKIPAKTPAVETPPARRTPRETTVRKAIARETIAPASVMPEKTAALRREEKKPESSPAVADAASTPIKFAPAAEIPASVPVSAPPMPNSPTSSPTPEAAPARTSPAQSGPAQSGRRAKSKPSSSTSPETDLKKARQRADDARERLARAAVPERANLQAQYLAQGDALLETSREREKQGDLSGALFYAQRAEEAFNQLSQSLKGARSR